MNAAVAAIDAGDVDKLRALLQQDGELAALALHKKHPDFAHCTLLHVCCFRSQLLCLEALADTPGVDLDARFGDPTATTGISNTRETALILACMYFPAGALALLRRGARPDLTDWSGHTALSRLEQRARDRPHPLHPEVREALQAALAQYEAGPAGTEAAALRASGNEAFQRRDFEEAVGFYQRSLALLTDVRTMVNLSAIYLHRARAAGIAKMHAQSDALWLDHHRHEYAQWMEALTTLIPATELAPKHAMVHYRIARAHLGLRDLPRALQSARDGLKANPDHPALHQLVHDLTALGVPDHASNRMSSIAERAKGLVLSGRAEVAPCPYCGASVPKPLAQWPMCPFCACDHTRELPPNAVDNLRLSKIM